MICLFRGSVGICGKHSATNRCEKHFGKKDKEPRQKIGKYRGFSVFADDVGLFLKRKGSIAKRKI